MARLRPENYIHGPTSPANSSTSNQSDADTSSAAGVGIGRGPRNPMFNIYDTSGKRIRTKDASTADGQRCLDEYHRTHGFYPKTYPDGIFIASFNVIRREVAEAAQRRASAGLSGGRQFSQGQNNNNNIPTISSNPNTSITTMADNTSTSNSISPMEDQTQSNQLGGNEFSSDGESSGTEAAQVNQAVVKQANTNYIIPNFDADLPPIPDIQKSFYQLEQERLHGPIRPPYFPKNEWNKPIGAFVYATKENSDSEEDSDDENERLKGVKALAEKKALNDSLGLWTPRNAMYYHKVAMRDYYQSRYPNISLAAIDAKIEQEYPITRDEEKRCLALAKENQEVVRVHNEEVLAQRN